MPAVPATTLVSPREEWPDADFDLPEGPLLHSASEKEEDDDDWDVEMNLGPTGGAKAQAVVAGLVARSEIVSGPLKLASSTPTSSSLINIRPPLAQVEITDDEDESLTTIKALPPPTIKLKPTVEPIEEDFEDGFALPSDLTRLSLAPQSLNHRLSKLSLEWNDKDNSSSQSSSDAYTTLGFTDPYSGSSTTTSLPDTETEEDDDLEGLVIPSGLFEPGQGTRQLNTILEAKKKVLYSSVSSKPSKQDPEEDFETGLVINDDVDFSPSRLVPSQRTSARSSISTRPSGLKPSPRPSKPERSKSPENPPTASAKQLAKLRLSPSPPLRPPSQTFQSFGSNFSPLAAIPSNNAALQKFGSLRGQKSTSGLKPPTPPMTGRRLTRKASMSGLLDATPLPPVPPVPVPTAEQIKISRYEQATAASRAKTHRSSSSRTSDAEGPPSRPPTPSSNPAALRLTMPTQPRLKTRPALSQVFAGGAGTSKRAPSPALVRPPSSSSLRPPSTASLRTAAAPQPQPRSQAVVSPPPVAAPLPPLVAPKLLRKPKRTRTYGDGSELDAFDDLPTDRDKETRYRVQPKGFGNRVPGSSFTPPKSTEKAPLDMPAEKEKDKGTIRKKSKGPTSGDFATSLPPPSGTLRRSSTRLDLTPKASHAVELPPKKKTSISPTATKRKPTLIRNLGGAGPAKVVGDMRWNPNNMRWEGNDEALRDFDLAAGTSTRPALITQLSGSACGSPAGPFASGAKVVGNMVFDPARMCWISTLAPEEDEPDVFANLADDEEDDWDAPSGTIRATAPRISDVSSVSGTSSHVNELKPPPDNHARSVSDSGGSDRGSRASMMVCDIDDAFVASCRAAEERHRLEMKGWKTSKREHSLASDRTFLYDIRALATRRY